MAAEIKVKYAAASATAITITLNSLASGAAREGTAVDNSSALLLDALVQVTVTTPALTPAADKAVYVYAYGALEATSPEYPSDDNGITGVDAAYTPNDPTNLKLIGVIPVLTASKTYRSEPLSVAAAFGGILPVKWGIVVLNKSGQALAASGNSAKYMGIVSQSV